MLGLERLPLLSLGFGSATDPVRWGFSVREVGSERGSGPRGFLPRTASGVVAKTGGPPRASRQSPRLKNPNPSALGEFFELGKSPSLCLFTNLAHSSLGVRGFSSRIWLLIARFRHRSSVPHGTVQPVSILGRIKIFT